MPRKNISIEYRNAEGKLDSIPQLVEELIRHKVDLLVTTNPEAMRAAKQATQTIPVVIVSSSDPVAMGIVDSLARPGGNITGISLLVRDLSGKRLSLLTEAVATIKRVAVLWDPDSAAARVGFKEYEGAGRSMKIAGIVGGIGPESTIEYYRLLNEEVGRRLGMPLGTVTKTLSRAYALLRQDLEQREREPLTATKTVSEHELR